MPRGSPKKVVILGGGVAGMSAAHELLERGFDVEIYERQRIPGGKARSVPVYPGVHGARKTYEISLDRWLASDGADIDPKVRRDWLPGEHGFRFFPGFYRHVVDTMSRIPYEKGTVADNLTPTSALLLARFDRDGILFPSRFPRDSRDVANVLDSLLKMAAGDLGVPFDDTAFFAGKIWQIMTSCHERRRDEYEKDGWWEFIGAADRSPAYQSFFGHGITRSLVAAKAELASTYTIGNTFLQLLFDIADPTIPTTDRLLNGPTNLVWIRPWLDYLQARGLKYHFHCPVEAITCSGGRIESVTVVKEGHPRTVRGDYYVAALPVERIAPLVTPAMRQADPGLAHLATLAKNVEWMNGIQFYLKRRVPIVHGHVIYIDSPWALTSVSQGQFWPDFDLGRFGDGSVHDVLSVDISDWNAKGLNGKTVRECSREEAARETWAQIKRSINVDGREELRDDDWDDWFMDPDINRSPDNLGVVVNTEPLLVNLKDTLHLRPAAATGISNFFLASDYVRTYTDLATMEGANEAARRAVNDILETAGSTAERCKIWPLHEPEFLEPFKAYDRDFRWRRGLSYDARLVDSGLWVVELLKNASGLLPTVMGSTAGGGPAAPASTGAAGLPGVEAVTKLAAQALHGAGSAVRPAGEGPPTGVTSAPPGSTEADVVTRRRKRKLRIVRAS